MAKNNKMKSSKTNGWDFLIHFIDIFYNVLTLKRISFAVVFAGATSFVIQSIKTPFQELIKPFYDIANSVQQSIDISIYTLIVTICLLVSLFGNFLQRFYYSNEIKKVSAQRSETIHGIESGHLKTLKIHHSSKESELKKESEDLFKDDNDNK